MFMKLNMIRMGSGKVSVLIRSNGVDGSMVSSSLVVVAWMRGVIVVSLLQVGRS